MQSWCDTKENDEVLPTCIDKNKKWRAKFFCTYIDWITLI